MLTSEILAALERLSSQILAQLEAAPAEALNWQPPLPDTNSLYVIAYHTATAGEWLIVQVACGQPMARDRDAEFRSQGDLDTLRACYAQWLDHAREALAELNDVDLAAVRRYQTAAGPAERSVAGVLLQAVGHTANHLGHIELTRQLWDAQAARGA